MSYIKKSTWDFDQTKLMWTMLAIGISLLVLAFSFILIPAYAQEVDVNRFYQRLEDPDACDKIRIFGEKAWVPIRLKITHPTTSDIDFRIDSSDPTKKSRDLVNNEGLFDFISEEVTTWTIGYTIRYPEPAERSMVIEFTSDGRPVQIENRKLNPFETCQIFEITTDVAPEIPDISDFLTDVGVESLQEMQYVVPAVIGLQGTQDRTTIVLGVFLFVVSLLIAYIFLKVKEISSEKIATQAQIITATQNANKQAEQAQKAVEYIKMELIPSIDKALENSLNNFDLNKNKILLDIKKAISKGDLKPGEKKGDKEDIYKEELMSEEEIIAIAEQKPEKESEEKPKDKTITNKVKDVIHTAISFAESLPEHLRKSQPTFMKRENQKIQIDFAMDQPVRPQKLRKLYKQNEYKVNESLYKKYWKLMKQYPKVAEIRKRADILKKVLEEYASDYEKKRQAEADISDMKNKEKKNK